MYRGFDLHLSSTIFDDAKYQIAGQAVFDETHSGIQKGLDAFKDSDGKLNGEKIMQGWFPDLHPHVFLSHSHKDHKDVVGLAGWLKINFGLDAFIDSCAWGYSGNLLKEIDDEYCQTKDNSYSYSKRNGSTTHVHLMLVNSLVRLINESECVIFLNTPNAISVQSTITSSAMTESPWIYTELMISRFIQTRTMTEHRSRKTSIHASRDKLAFENLEVRYVANLGHLTPLTQNDLFRWKDKFPKRPVDPLQALDSLYGQHADSSPGSSHLW